MQPHRFRDQLGPWSRPSPPQQPQVLPQAFVMCPPALMAAGGGAQPFWQHLYSLAFAEAQAVIRPSLPERDLLASWN